MTRNQTPLLDALSLDLPTAISKANIQPSCHHGRTVSASAIKRLLQFVASYSSKCCTLPVESFNADGVGIADKLATNPRTVRLAIAGAIEQGLLTATGTRTRRQLSITSANLAKLKSMIPIADKCPNHSGTRPDIELEHIEKETTTTEPELVVVLLNLGMQKAREAYAKATMMLHLTDQAIRERIADWERLPEDKQLVGTLYNWLTLPGSYRPSPVDPNAIFKKLKLNREMSGQAAVDRNAMIRRLNAQGQALPEIQVAVDRLEADWLRRQASPL